jgi:hypothetical protein
MDWLVVSTILPQALGPKAWYLCHGIWSGVESYSHASSGMAKKVSISYNCIPAAAFCYILYPVI